MEPYTNVPPPAPAGTDNQRIMAIASLVIGILNLCAWLVPVCGFLLGAIGVVLGVLGMKSPTQKNLAIAGLVLSAIGIVLACGNSLASLFLGPQIGNIFSSINQSLNVP